MITETATVIQIKQNQTWIETQRRSTCGQCSASKGCGTSVLSKVVGNKFSKMRAVNNIDAKVGDEVTVGLNESTLLKGAFMTYILPLMYLFSFALIGQALASNELIIISFAVVGFYFGLLHLKRFSLSIADNENYQPVLLKKNIKSIP
ncbi:MAG: SoxR reducing system RseC family protein [Woeseiaceae bacterium]